MCTHYICGINDCKNFAHVIYMSQEISKLLPFFKYEIMSLNKEDFEEWYHHFFTVNNLMTLRRHMSPVVWRQWLGDGSRTSVELIGGFSEFVEFCKTCLHVDSLWTPKEVEALSEKILKTASLVPPVEGFCVCILGAGHPSTRLLVFELLTNAKSIFNQSLHLLLCDCTCGSNEKMKQIAKDALYLQEESIVEVVSTLDVALKHCQLLIITKQIDRKQDNILSMYFDFMVDVADLFVKHSRRSCRILLACTGYSCFNASVFMREYARVNGKQVPPNIAAVTSYKATECLHFLKHASSARMEELFGTPVWGFIEQNEGLVVDYLMTKYIRTKKMLVLPDGLLSLESILSKDTTLKTLSSNFEIESETNASKSYKTEEGEEEDSELDLENELVDMLMKGIRSDSVKFEYVKSSATLAEIEYKLRNVRDFVKLQKDSIFFLFDEEPLIPQVNATIDLLRFWYDKDEPDSTSQNCPSNEKIIFAGIPTDGSFGMKSGLVLSQPAVLNNGYLVPYAEYTEQRSYGKNKLDRAYTMVDSFGLYWDYGNYETDMLLKTLWLKFGDEIRQKTDLTTTEEKEAPTDYVRSLKSRIKMAIKEQKTLLKELGAVAKREAKERGEISEIELSDLDLETETIKSVSKKSKEEKISGVVSVERETEEEKIIDEIEIEPPTEIKSQAESIKVEESPEEPAKTSEESGVVLTDSVFKENVVIDEIQNVMEPLTDKPRLSVGSKNDKSLANLSRKSDEKEQINTLSEGDKLIIEENIQNEAIDNQIENKSLSKHSKDSERLVIETEKEKDLIGNEEKEVVLNEDLTVKKTLSSHSKDNIQSEVQLITEPELENVLETNLVEGGDTKNEDVQNENQTEKKSLSNKSKENIESEVQKETVENINTDLTDEGDTKIEEDEI